MLPALWILFSKTSFSSPFVDVVPLPLPLSKVTDIDDRCKVIDAHYPNIVVVHLFVQLLKYHA